MIGISGYVSTYLDDDSYNAMSREEKLNHDIICIKMAGYSAYEPYEIVYNRRQNQIKQIQRLIKLERLNEQFH